MTETDYKTAKRLVGPRIGSTIRRYLSRMPQMHRADIRGSLETDLIIYLSQMHERESPGSVFVEWLEQKVRVEWVYLRNRVVDVIRSGRYTMGAGHRAFDSHLMPGFLPADINERCITKEPGHSAVEINDTLNFYFTPRQIEAVNMRVSNPEMSKVNIAKKMGIDWRELDRIYARVKEVMQ